MLSSWENVVFVGKCEIVDANPFTVQSRQNIPPPHPHRNQSNNDLRSPKIVQAQCAQLYSLAETSQPALSPRIWSHIRGRYWSAKIDGISLWPPACGTPYLVLAIVTSYAGDEIDATGCPKRFGGEARRKFDWSVCRITVPLLIYYACSVRTCTWYWILPFTYHLHTYGTCKVNIEWNCDILIFGDISFCFSVSKID